MTVVPFRLEDPGSAVKEQPAGPLSQDAKSVIPEALDLRHAYSLMHLARVLDDKAPNYLKQGLGWSYHAPCAGHDGIQIALGLTFRQGQDYLFPYYRDLATCLAAGISVEEILLNGLSKRDDVAAGGRHMSNHFAKPAIGIQNVSSCVANHAQHAAGLGRAIVTYDSDAIVFCSLGESSTSEGYFYEAVNGASREKLPVVFVVQDNGYGISVPKSDQTANRFASDNFAGFLNLEILHCDGTELVDSMRALQSAVRYVASGAGCALVHAECVRIHSHSNSDRHELYRSREELDQARARDPLARLRARVLEERVASEEELASIERENLGTYEACADRVRRALDPDPATILDFVVPDPWRPEGDGFADLDRTPVEAEGTALPEMSLIEALNSTLKALFRENPDTYLWGQDVANKDKGGIFNVSKGLQQEFGARRIFNGPIAEDYILGTADGFSRFDDRIRIVVEGAEFADYFWPAAEQMVEMSHEYWRTRGQFVPNVTIRLASGGYIGGGLYHSQNIEGWLATLPDPDRGAGLRRRCSRIASDGRPLPRNHGLSRAEVSLQRTYGTSPRSARLLRAIRQARRRRAGSELTIVTYGTAVHLALEAAEHLAEEGRSVEVLDLRSLVPLDWEAVSRSVRKTSRALVVHEDKVHGGFGGEIAAQIASKLFAYLDAPVDRVGSVFTPVGFHRVLERAILPDVDRVLEAARRTLAY